MDNIERNKKRQLMPTPQKASQTVLKSVMNARINT